MRMSAHVLNPTHIHKGSARSNGREYADRMSPKQRGANGNRTDQDEGDQVVELILRAATEDDAAGIAQVYVDTCRAAAAGTLPADFDEKLTIAKQTRAWRTTVGVRELVLVAVLDEEVLAFASGGRSEDGDPFFRGVVDAMYVEPDIQRQRLGTQLFIEMLHRLRDLAPILAWVPEENLGARRFCEALGGLPVRRAAANAKQRRPATIGYAFFDVG